MIFDTNDIPMRSANFAITSEESEILTIKIACLDGWHIGVTEYIETMTAEIRAVGDVSWHDLEADGSFDLTPWDATTQAFEIRFTAGSVTSRERRRVGLQLRDGQHPPLNPPTYFDVNAGSITFTGADITFAVFPRYIEVTAGGISVTGADVYVGEPLDADATAYFSATGITDPTTRTAIENLITAIKAISSGDVWTNKLKVIYPFPGTTAGINAVNLRSPGTFNGTMNGTITHNANGVTGNGSTGYIDTGFNQSTDGAEDDEHLSVYSRTSGSASTLEAGVTNASSFGTQMFVQAATVNFAARCQSQTQASPTTDGTGLGYFSLNRTANTGYRARQNGTNSNVTQGSDTAVQNGNFTILARNRVGSTVTGFSARNLAWAAIGRGLTEAEDGALRTAVEAYQDELSRGVVA